MVPLALRVNKAAMDFRENKVPQGNKVTLALKVCMEKEPLVL